MKLRLKSPTSLKFGGPILINCTTWPERVTLEHNSVAYTAAVVHSLVKSGSSKKSTWSQQNQNKSEKLDAARYICNIYIYIIYLYYRTYNRFKNNNFVYYILWDRSLKPSQPRISQSWGVVPQWPHRKLSLLCNSSFLWNTDFINQLTVTNLRLTN